MDLVANITKHSVLVCVEKQERGLFMQTVLAKAGFKVVVVMSLYDALRVVAQELPHLIITVSSLSDGTAAILFDRLQADPMLKKIPILVNAVEKTKEALTALTKRPFAGFLVGQLEPVSFMAKVNDTINQRVGISPFFVPAANLNMDAKTTISIEATVVGKSRDHVVAKSMVEIDPNASLVCLPRKDGFGPALFANGFNLKQGETVFNMFPLTRVTGSGRKWIGQLTEFDTTGKPGTKKSKTVLFYDPNPQRAEGFGQILQGYGIRIEYAKFLSEAAAMITSDATRFGAIYLHELLNDTTAAPFKDAYRKLLTSNRPPLIVGTTMANAKSSPGLRYIKRPFGMGVLLEVLEASFERADGVADGVASTTGNAIEVPVSYEAPATLLGLDETGGIVQLRFPLARDARVKVSHGFLQKVWGAQSVVMISGMGPVPGRPDVWQARFEVMQAGSSKAKYWEKMLKELAPVTRAPAAPEAVAPAV